MIKKSIKFILLVSVILILVSAVNAKDLNNTNPQSLTSDSTLTKTSDSSVTTLTNDKADTTTKKKDLTKTTSKNSTKTKSQKVIYVSKKGKDSNIGTKSKPKKTIKNAISNVKKNGVIYILTGTFKEYNLKITKSMSIIGVGNSKTTINANKKGRIFKISPKTTVSIKNLRLKNGKVKNANGGSIFAKKANLSLYKIKIINSISTSSDASKNGCAGAIMAHGGKLKINHCTIINSRSSSNGGAICAWNIYLTMTKTILKNNIALDNSYSVGGAIAIDKHSKVIIKSSNFINNSARAGGVVSLFRSNSYLKMNGCSFIGNSANKGQVLYKGSNADKSYVNFKYNWWNALKPKWNKLIKDYNKNYKHPKSWIVVKFNSTKNFVYVSANKSSSCKLIANFNYFRTFKSSKLKYRHSSVPIWNLNVTYRFSDKKVLYKKTVNAISKIKYKHKSNVKNTVTAYLEIYGKLISSLKLKYLVI